MWASYHGIYGMSKTPYREVKIILRLDLELTIGINIVLQGKMRGKNE